MVARVVMRGFEVVLNEATSEKRQRDEFGAVETTLSDLEDGEMISSLPSQVYIATPQIWRTRVGGRGEGGGGYASRDRKGLLEETTKENRGNDKNQTLA